jgi:DNA-binding IclR family transcriptional regulator
VSQQEQAAMAAVAATTSGVAVSLEVQLIGIHGVAAPLSPHPTAVVAPASVATPALAAALGQVAPTMGTIEASSVTYLHTQVAGIQDIRSVVPVVLGVTST